jgi:hypothetical protein
MDIETLVERAIQRKFAGNGSSSTVQSNSHQSIRAAKRKAEKEHATETTSKRVAENKTPLELGSIWKLRASRLASHFNTELDKIRVNCAVRPRLEITFDPLREKRAMKGDDRFRSILKTLSAFGDRSRDQQLWHYWFLQACLPWIYKEEWDTSSSAILERHNLNHIIQQVLCMAPRRFGKTYCVAMFVAALILCIPGLQIAVFSAAKRQSGQLAKKVREFINLVPGGKERIICKNAETIAVGLAEHVGIMSASEQLELNTTAVVKSYPAAVDCK